MARTCDKCGAAIHSENKVWLALFLIVGGCSTFGIAGAVMTAQRGEPLAIVLIVLGFVAVMFGSVGMYAEGEDEGKRKAKGETA